MASIFTIPAVIATGIASAVSNAANKNKSTNNNTNSSANNASSTNNTSSGNTTTKINQNTNQYPNGYTEHYTGGNAQLDALIKEQSDKYFAAKAQGDANAMREANDRANQYRNQFGYAAESANTDINGVIAANRNQSGGGSSLSASGNYSGTSYPINDYSQYIEEMNQAKQQAALAELRAAYDKNLAAFDRTSQQIPVEYQNARNQAAAQAAIQQQNFNEYAAANGLNSGTGGQAQLSFQNQLQNNLSSIGQQEAASLADLELQRTQAESDYNLAIAQAQAQGDYELAQQLYAEKVRVDEALREQIMWQAQQEFSKLQFDTANQQWQQQFDASMDQYNQGLLADKAATLAQYGDFSGYKALGYTDEQIAAMENYYNTMMNRSNYSGGSGGGTGGGNPVSYDNGSLTSDQVKELQAALGLEADGYWGPASQEATGLSADEAWMQLNSTQNNIGNNTTLYIPGLSRVSSSELPGLIESGQVIAEIIPGTQNYRYKVNPDYDKNKMSNDYFSAQMRTIASLLNQGDSGRQKAFNSIDNIWDNLTLAQKNEVDVLLAKFGYAYQR